MTEEELQETLRQLRSRHVLVLWRFREMYRGKDGTTLLEIMLPIDDADDAKAYLDHVMTRWTERHILPIALVFRWLTAIRIIACHYFHMFVAILSRR